MKRKLYQMAFGVICLVLSLTYACKKSAGTEPETLSSARLETMNRPVAGGISVNNGWLKFESLGSFNEAMKVMHEKFADEKELGKWETAYRPKGYISLRSLYEQNEADTSDDRRQLTVDSLIKAKKILDCPDSYFATVLNKDGFIQIADTIYSFSPVRMAYAIPEKYTGEIVRGTDMSKLQGIGFSRSSFFDPPILQWNEKNIGGATGLPICQYPSGLMPQWWGQVGGDIFRGDDNTAFPEHNGREVKLNYHRWRVGYIFYASAGVRLKMYKHTRFAGWLSVTYADEMLIESCCKGKIFIPGLPLLSFNEQTAPAWPAFARYSENNFEKTMKWTASGLFNEIILEHFNFHFRVNYRGRVVERDIRQ